MSSPPSSTTYPPESEHATTSAPSRCARSAAEMATFPEPETTTRRPDIERPVAFSISSVNTATPYPVACSPQAWAATATFGLLAACLGLELGHQQNEIRFRDPVMPDFLNEVTIRDLKLADSRVDLRLHRYGNDVTANVLSRQGSSRVLLLK